MSAKNWLQERQRSKLYPTGYARRKSNLTPLSVLAMQQNRAFRVEDFTKENGTPDITELSPLQAIYDSTNATSTSNANPVTPIYQGTSPNIGNSLFARLANSLFA